MKQKTSKVITKLMLPVVACAVMLYSSCRKSDITPPVIQAGQSTNTTKPANDALSKQIVANLAHSLGGTYGSANMMKGIDSLNLAGHKEFNTLLCGLYTDSLVNRNGNQGDTVSHMGGNLTFSFNCNNGTPAGYTAFDSLATTRQLPNGWYQFYYIKQAYTIKCLDDKHEFIGVDGDNYFYQYMKLLGYTDNKLHTDIESCNFVLSNLTIDVCKKDILSGTATFTATGYDWNVTGTVNFVGNYIADVTIDGTVYHIDIRDYSW